MYLSTDAIVLKNIHYKDSSIISRIYTESKGKISIIYKGIKKNKNNLIAIIEPSNVINITYYDNSKSTLKISKEIHSKTVFTNNRKQIENYYYSMAIISLVDALCEEEESNAHLFHLIIDSLSYINNHIVNKELIFLYFLINLNTLLGSKIRFSLSNNFNNQYHHLIKPFDSSIRELSVYEDSIITNKDFIKKIKRIIFLHMKTHLIDLNTIYSIKMLKDMTDER